MKSGERLRIEFGGTYGDSFILLAFGCGRLGAV